MEKVKLSREKLKINRSENAHLSFERDYAVYGFSCPQIRNYKCTFCAKEFKSAQALGGHMNVHRRDRARLRQSPSSWDIPSNPNFSSHSSSSSTSSTAVRFVPYPPNLYQHPLVSSSYEERVPLIAHSARHFVGPKLGDVNKKLSMGMESNVGELKGCLVQENGVWKAREMARMGIELELELELGLVRDAKEGLDLELRLGQSI